MIYTDSAEAHADHEILASLEAYFEDGIAPDIPTSHADIITLWETCWEVWFTCDPSVHLALGTFMAAIKAAYPALPGKPSWTVLDDPEEF